MTRRKVVHNCEGCGAPRMVSPDKIAKGLQRYCRKCQGPIAGKKRSEAMIKRGGPRSVTYRACSECACIYEMQAVNDDGYCSIVCKLKAQARGCSMSGLKRKVSFLMAARSNKERKKILSEREHFIQQSLFSDKTQ